MRFKCEIRHIAQAGSVPLFNVDPLPLLFYDRMTQIPHKIKVDVSILFDNLVHILIQFLKCRVRSDKAPHFSVKFFFHGNSLFPLLIGTGLAVNNYAVLDNESTRIIAPNIATLRAQINRYDVIFTDDSAACLILRPAH